MQNRCRVLIAACDTFRSGAVEQLRVHVRNLNGLAGGGNGASVELFEKGYGKDAAGIAKDAIAYGKKRNFVMWRCKLNHPSLFLEATASGLDVVLIDTAGRMQDNEPLMRSLAKVSLKI